MRIVRLSFPLDEDGPRPPAIPKPELTPLYTIDADGANVQIVRAASHTGTHVDAPLHVVDGGLSLHDFSPEELIYTRPLVLDLDCGEAEVVMPLRLEPFARRLNGPDILLLRFGWGGIRREEPRRYSERAPGFGVESARWLRDRLHGIRAVGMDVPSLSCIDRLEATMEAHNILLSGRRLLVVEDMNLEHDLSDLSEVRVNPWLVRGMDSGPCSVSGVLDPG